MKNSNRNFKIAGKNIGPDYPPYCIAEVGINHNGDLSLAKKMIKSAKDAGVDAVKFQTFKAEEFCSDSHQMFTYKSQGKKITESMLEMFQRYELPLNSWWEIREYCQKLDITFFSTPQNIGDLRMLEKVGVPAIKIGSDDLTNIPLINAYASTGLPLILSCGMSDLAEVQQGLEAAKWFEGQLVALLLCTSQYPTPPEDVHINKLTTLQNAFPGLLVGFSDHTQNSLAACLAISRGARIFEKHFTLDNNLPGPDHWFSENPKGLGDWVTSIHMADTMMGNHFVKPTNKEQKMKLVARRSIVALKEIKCGDILNSSNIDVKRPGDGLPPSFLPKLFGLKASRDIKNGEKLLLSDLTS